MKRCILIILDSFGVGAMPDAAHFDDVGADTFGHILKACPDVKLPNLEALGLYDIDGLSLPKQANRTHPPLIGSFGKCAEKSDAKDTTNGHFEIAGLLAKKPFRIYKDGFPPTIIKKIEEATGTGLIGNKPASGTEIIQELGDEHVRTGYPIIYTSADSVLQLAMHEDVIPLERQYEICEIVRKIMCGDDTVGRVIARPFVGSSGHYTRTENRKDYSVDPPGETLLDYLKAQGKETIAVGKIEDIFNHRGITRVDHTKNNRAGIESTIRLLGEDFEGLLFVNLVDYDMLYGHRRDPRGYADALMYFDSFLPQIMGALKEEDLLIITADHGCDPTHHGTDHTREYTPLLVAGKGIKAGVNLGIRNTFADVAATVADCFGGNFSGGKSFLPELT